MCSKCGATDAVAMDVDINDTNTAVRFLMHMGNPEEPSSPENPQVQFVMSIEQCTAWLEDLRTKLNQL